MECIDDEIIELPGAAIEYSGESPGHLTRVNSHGLDYPWRNFSSEIVSSQYHVVDVYDLNELPNKKEICEKLDFRLNEDGTIINLEYGLNEDYVHALVAIDPSDISEPLGQVNVGMSFWGMPDCDDELYITFYLYMAYVPKKYRHRYIGSSLAMVATDVFIDSVEQRLAAMKSEISRVNITLCADWDSEEGKDLSEKIYCELRYFCESLDSEHEGLTIVCLLDAGF